MVDIITSARELLQVNIVIGKFYINLNPQMRYLEIIIYDTSVLV